MSGIPAFLLAFLKMATVLLTLIYFIFVTGIESIINYSDWFSYNNDVKSLFSLAEQIGYTKKNELAYHRSKGSTSSNHDLTNLVFSTDDDLVLFSQKVNKLSLSPDSSSSTPYHRKQYKDHNFIQSINNEYPYTITLTDLRSEQSVLPNDLIPTVTSWRFMFSSTKAHKRIRISYAELPKSEIFWRHKPTERVIKGAVVHLKLSR